MERAARGSMAQTYTENKVAMQQVAENHAPDRPPGRFCRLQTFSQRASAVSAIVGMLIIALVMIFTVCDVVMRFTLSRPLAGAVDVMTYGLALAVAAVMPWGFAKNSHVSVDILSTTLPPRPRAVLDCAINLVCAIAIGALAWRLWLLAGSRRASGDRMWILQFETWPLWYAVAAGFGACVFVCLIVAVSRISEAFEGSAS
ncbi:TRAP transporter small permease [Saliniramus fredricksonii]|nr:TRAP transporter small permease [Saliniramus fredricksonii]